MIIPRWRSSSDTLNRDMPNCQCRIRSRRLRRLDKYRYGYLTGYRLMPVIMRMLQDA